MFTSVGWRRSAACRSGAAIEHELSQTVDGAPATFDVEAVEALPALPLPDEEPGVGEHLQMMGHRRARERKARGERADVQPLARQRDDDPLANGVAERDEEAAEVGQLRALRDGCSLVHPFKHLNQSTKAVKPRLRARHRGLCYASASFRFDSAQAAPVDTPIATAM